MNKDCKKVRFATEKDAEYFIDKLKKTSNRTKVPKSCYFCFPCNAWHMTSQIPHAKKELIELRKEMESLKLAHKGEIDLLVKEISRLKQATSKEVSVDVRIKKMNETVAEKLKVISRLRQDNSELISKNIQLEKQVKNK